MSARVEQTAAVEDTRSRPRDYEYGASGIHLYVLFAAPAEPAVRYGSLRRDTTPWEQPRRESTLAESHHHFWHEVRQLDGWRLTHISTIDGPVGNQSAQSVPLPQLGDVLRAMLSDAHRLEAEIRRTETAVLYAMLHIERLIAPSASAPGPTASGSSSYFPSRSPNPQLRAALEIFDPLPPGDPRGFFDHYEPRTSDRAGHYGYLAVTRHVALLADHSMSQFLVLAALLQTGAIRQEGGLTDETLSAVLTRVTEWDMTQDVKESVDHLMDIKEGGDAATRGQVWLAYALAVIGVALSLISYIKEPLWELPGFVLLGASCVAQARHAQVSSKRAHAIGKALFWCGAALLIIGAAASIVGTARLAW